MTGADGMEPGGIRLNKLLAERVGLARRRCDEAILRGEVSVDGVAVDTPGLVLDPARHAITFRGEPLPGAPAFHYLMLHKPLGVLVTWSDPQGRPTVKDYVPPGLPRMFAVGRLDSDTSGPARPHQRRRADPSPGPPALRGPQDLPAHPRARADARRSWPRCARAWTWARARSRARRRRPRSRPRAATGAVVRLVIAEGKNRQVRRMCKAVGPVAHRPRPRGVRAAGPRGPAGGEDAAADPGRDSGPAGGNAGPGERRPG